MYGNMKYSIMNSSTRRRTRTRRTGRRTATHKVSASRGGQPPTLESKKRQWQPNKAEINKENKLNWIVRGSQVADSDSESKSDSKSDSHPARTDSSEPQKVISKESCPFPLNMRCNLTWPDSLLPLRQHHHRWGRHPVHPVYPIPSHPAPSHSWHPSCMRGMARSVRDVMLRPTVL